VHGLPAVLLFNVDGKAYKFEGHRDQVNIKQFIEGGFQGFRPLDFRQPNILERVVGAINSYGVVGTMVFATSLATFLYVCFSAIFKERPAKNIKPKQTDTTSPQPETEKSRDSASPPRSKRD
jgi:hypothetical protein